MMSPGQAACMTCDNDTNELMCLAGSAAPHTREAGFRPGLQGPLARAAAAAAAEKAARAQEQDAAADRAAAAACTSTGVVAAAAPAAAASQGRQEPAANATAASLAGAFTPILCQSLLNEQGLVCHHTHCSVNPANKDDTVGWLVK